MIICVETGNTANIKWPELLEILDQCDLPYFVYKNEVLEILGPYQILTFFERRDIDENDNNA